MFLKKIKNKISEMQNDISNMQKKIEQYNTKMEESLDQLERIVQYGRSDKITYQCNCYKNYSYCYDTNTYIYKDMKEYQIKHLDLSKSAICEQGEKENIIYITDTYDLLCDNKTITEKYIVDLYQKSYMLLSKSEVDIPEERNVVY